MIAVLSDIHANLPALDAVIADLPRVSSMWVLGDSTGELPYPCEVLDRLTELNETMPVVQIAGNRELSLLEAKDGLHPDWWTGTQLRLLAWTCENLRPDHWLAMRALPTAQTLTNIPGGAALFHGAPNDVRRLITTQLEAEAALQGVPQRWLAGGHCHSQSFYHLDSRAYLNAGSVGISMMGLGAVASYALLDETRSPADPACVTFRHIPYDVEAVVCALQRRGLTELAPGVARACTLELRTGIYHLMPLIHFCMAYAERALGHPVDAVPAELWREAELLWDGRP